MLGCLATTQHFTPHVRIYFSAVPSIRLWDVDYHTTMEYLCSRLLRDFTELEWAQYGVTDDTPACP